MYLLLSVISEFPSLAFQVRSTKTIMYVYFHLFFVKMEKYSYSIRETIHEYMIFTTYSNTNANTFILKKSTNTEYCTNTQEMYSNSIRNTEYNYPRSALIVT